MALSPFLPSNFSRQRSNRRGEAMLTAQHTAGRLATLGLLLQVDDLLPRKPAGLHRGHPVASTRLAALGSMSEAGTDSGSNRLHACGLGMLLREKIDVGPLDELRWSDA